MRIIAGTAKGRKLASPAGKQSGPIRPTADRAREALFSIIGQKIRHSKVLDLFSGTGAIGLEAISRGADFAVFTDESALAIDLIKRNLTTCGFASQAVVLRRDLLKGLSFLKGAQPCSLFDLIFLDPPYGKDIQERIIKEVCANQLLAADGLLIAEERAQIDLPQSIEDLMSCDLRRYGDTAFWFYCRKAREAV